MYIAFSGSCGEIVGFTGCWLIGQCAYSMWHSCMEIGYESGMQVHPPPHSAMQPARLAAGRRFMYGSCAQAGRSVAGLSVA